MNKGPSIIWDELIAARGLKVSVAQHLTLRQNGRKASWLVADWLTCNVPGLRLVNFKTGYLLKNKEELGLWQLRLMTKVLSLSRSEGKGKGRQFSQTKQDELPINGWLIVDCPLLPNAPSWWLRHEEADRMKQDKILTPTLTCQRAAFLEYAAKYCSN